MMCVENDLRNGQTVSSCIMTMLHVTHRFWYSNLSNKNITVCPHPPYSPDLAWCNFWLFPKVKKTMKGKCFELIQDTEAATTAQLKTLMKEDFQNCFRNWQERWDKCVQRGGILRGINGNVSFIVIIFLI